MSEKENKELTDKLMTANKKMMSGQEELECLQMKQETLMMTLQSFQEDQSVVNTKLDAAKQEIIDLKNDLNKKSKLLNASTTGSESSQSIIGKLKDENKVLKSELAALKIAISSLKEGNKSNASKQNEEVANLRSNIQVLQKQIQEKDSELDVFKHDLESTQEKLIDIESEYNVLKQDEIASSQDIVEFKRKLEERASGYDRLNEQNLVLTNDLDKAKEANSRLLNELSEKNNNLQLRINEISEINEENKNLQSKLENNLTSIASLEEELKSSNNAKSQLTAENKSLSQKVASLNCSMQELENDLKFKVDEIEQLKANVTDDQIVEELKQKFCDMEQELENSIGKHQNETKNLQDEMKSWRADRDKVYEELVTFVNILKPESFPASTEDVFSLSKQSLAIIKEEFAVKNKLIEELKTGKEDLTSKVLLLEQDIKSNAESQQKLTQDLEEHQLDTEKQSSNIEQLTSKNIKFSDELLTKTKLVANLEEQLSDVNNDLQIKQEELISVKSSLEDQIKLLQSNLEGLQKQVDVTEMGEAESIKSLTFDLKEQKEKLDTLECVLNSTKQELEEEKNFCIKYKSDADNLDCQVVSLKNKILEIQNVVSGQEEEILSYKKQLEESKSKINEAGDNDKMISDAKTELDNVSKQLSDLTTECEKLRPINEELMDTVKSKELETTAIVENHADAVRILENEKLKMQENCEELQRTIEQLNEDQTVMKTSHDSALNDYREKHTTELAEKSAEIQQLNKTVQELRNDMEILQHSNDEITQMRQQSSKELEIIQQSVSDYQNKIIKLESEREELLKFKVNLEQTGETEKALLDDFKQTIAKLQSELDETNKAKNTLESNLTEVKDLNGSLNKNCKEFEVNNDALKIEVSSLTGTLETLKKDHQKMIDAKTEELQTLQESLKNSEEQCCALEQEKHDLLTSVKSLEMGGVNKNEEVAELQQELNKIQKELEANKQEHEVLQNEKTTLLAQVAELTETSQTMEKKNLMLQSNLNDLNVQSNEKTKAYEDLKSEIEKIQDINDQKIKEKVAEFEEKLDEIASLRDNVEQLKSAEASVEEELEKMKLEWIEEVR